MINPIIDEKWLVKQLAMIHWNPFRFKVSLDECRRIRDSIQNLPVCKKEDCPESEWC